MSIGDATVEAIFKQAEEKLYRASQKFLATLAATPKDYGEIEEQARHCAILASTHLGQMALVDQYDRATDMAVKLEYYLKQASMASKMRVHLEGVRS